MAKVTSPRGEKISVKRRWFPWPHFTSQERMEAWGVSDTAAKIIAITNVGDWIILGLISFIYLIFLVVSFNFFMVATVIMIIALAVRFLGLPWRIDVIYNGQVVECEKSDGFTQTTHRIAKIAALYENGGLRLPLPPQAGKPKIQSRVPIPGQLPSLKEYNTDNSPTLGSFSTKPENKPTPSGSGIPLPGPQPVMQDGSMFDETEEFEEPTRVSSRNPLRATPQPQQVDREESPLFVEPLVEMSEEASRTFTGESPLRRAIRLMEEEEQQLEKYGVKKPVDNSATKKASGKKGIFNK